MNADVSLVGEDSVYYVLAGLVVAATLAATFTLGLQIGGATAGGDPVDPAGTAVTLASVGVSVVAFLVYRRRR